MFSSAKTCLLLDQLEGKTVIVTGSNSGIGKETVAELARRGAKVIMACRDQEKGKLARQDLLDSYSAKIEYPKTSVALSPKDQVKHNLKEIKEDQLVLMKLDLVDYASVRAFAEQVNKSEPKIDILVNNAGAYFQKSFLTANGNECHVDVNYLGPFLLTELLMDKLKASKGRIVNVASKAYNMSPRIDISRLDLTDDRKDAMFKAYGYSKLLNIMHAKQLSKKYAAYDVVAASLHPGVIDTNFSREASSAVKMVLKLGKPFMRTLQDGAQTTLYCCLLPNIVPGAFYTDCAEANISSPDASDESIMEAIYNWSKERVGLN